MMKQPIRGNGGTRKWGIPFLLCICWLLSVSHAAPTYGSESQTRRTAETRDSQFAIGNFDGDRQPDLATIELVRFNSLHSRYLVSFRLSSGRLQTMGVTGPSEGLALLARDVNGDRALDLVLVTAWQHELIAVLLNDGAGNFAAADPVQFRFNAFSSTIQVGTAPKRIDEGTILALQYSFAGNLDRDRWTGISRESKRACLCSLGYGSSLSQSSILGRAPPSSVLQA